MTKYTIKKFSNIGKKPQIVAKFNISEAGELSYEMLISDSDVENVLIKAREQKGLECLVPFRCNVGGLNMVGQKKGFVKTTELTHIMDAIEYNLKNGLVEKE